MGEILLNSMDADGTRAGFDLKMIAAVRAAVDVPVIASGGAGAVEHFAPAVAAGADAVLAASVFHFGRCGSAGQGRAARGDVRCGERRGANQCSVARGLAALGRDDGGGAGASGLDPAIAARLKRDAGRAGVRRRAAGRHPRGADGGLDGRRGAAPHAHHRARPRTGRAAGRATGSRAIPPGTSSTCSRCGSTATETRCWWSSTRRARPATPATGRASTRTCCWGGEEASVPGATSVG